VGQAGVEEGVERFEGRALLWRQRAADEPSSAWSRDLLAACPRGPASRSLRAALCPRGSYRSATSKLVKRTKSVVSKPASSRWQRCATTATGLAGSRASDGGRAARMRGQHVLDAHRRKAGHGPSPAAIVACHVRR
jgi:hypothetical protein